VEGQAVIVWGNHGKVNQQWRVVYLDEDKGEQEKGLDKDWGFYINRPFYFVSRLPMHRVIECVGANNIVLKRYYKNRIAQQFYFDGTSKTLKSQQWKDRSISIQSNGGN
jgi:uncharacterized protein (UPF0248 family)